MGGRTIRGLKTSVGWERCISRGSQMGQVELRKHTSWRSPKTKTQC